MKSRFLVAARALTFLVAVFGCAKRGSEKTVFDFVKEFPKAEVQNETWIVDLGTPAGRPFMASGWSLDERWAGQYTFAWGIAPRSILRVSRFGQNVALLRFRCHPLTWQGSPPQILTILVNGRSVAQLRLADQFSIYEVPLPPAVLRKRQNDVEFRYGRSGFPPSVNANERRPLAVAFDWVEFVEPGTAARDTQPSAIADKLLLPFRCEVSYEAEVNPGDAIAIDDLRLRGVLPAKATCDVVIDASAGGRPVGSYVAHADQDGGAARVALRLSRTEKVKVSFSTGAVTPTDEGGIGVELKRPRIVRATSRGPA